MKCAKCGTSTIHPAQVELERNVAEHRFFGLVEGHQCPMCKETYVAGPVVERFELAVAATLAEAAVVSGAAVKFMRKAMGVRAVDLAKLLGVVPETVSRWETDRTVIDRSALAVLTMLVLDQASGASRTQDLLRALAEPKPLDEQVRLKVA